jgi:hypothetical protein
MCRSYLIPIASAKRVYRRLVLSDVDGGLRVVEHLWEDALVRKHFRTACDRIQGAVIAAPDVHLVPPERGLLHFRGRRLQLQVMS